MPSLKKISAISSLARAPSVSATVLLAPDACQLGRDHAQCLSFSGRQDCGKESSPIHLCESASEFPRT